MKVNFAEISKQSNLDHVVLIRIILMPLQNFTETKEMPMKNNYLIKLF